MASVQTSKLMDSVRMRMRVLSTFSCPDPRGGRTRSRGNIFADSAVKFPYIWPLIVFGLSFRNWLRFDSV